MDAYNNLLSKKIEEQRVEIDEMRKLIDVISDYVQGHRSDIEHNINDFGELLPLLKMSDGELE